MNDSFAIVPNQNVLESSTSNNRLLSSRKANEILAINEFVNKQVKESENAGKIVYDGMTLNELAAKLDRNLYSTLSGYGMVFAELSVKYDVDPYMALAIVLHETGCASGTCSYMARVCNNIGGMKGSGACAGGAYAKFSTLDAGIEAFFSNLSRNYYRKGLTTPESIGRKYAESTTWPTKVRYYIGKIKNS